MKTLAVLVFLLASTAANAQWQAVHLADGYYCRHAPDGQTVASGNVSAKFSDAVCNSWNRYPAAAQPIPYALAVDPTCAVFGTLLDVKLGTRFVTPAYETCFSGDERATATWAVERIDGDAVAAFTIDSHGVLTHAGGAAGSGHLALVRTAASGVALRIPRAWRVAP